jgi:hypothetical protein
MTVLQPHYITAGRYTPRTDRKLFAGIFDTTSDGAIMTGVLPPLKHFQVTHSGLTVSVSPGFAVIADSSSQNTDSPGVYLCTIDANPETLTLPTDAGVYQIYAQVSEAQSTVTTKALTSNVATITTSASHGFLVGETVLVTGVDSTFDGSYVITAKTSTTFSYTKVETDVVSVADTGYASVPFAIKATAAAGSVPPGSNITLAEVTVAASVIASTNDKRTFVTSRGGVQLWRSVPVAGTYTATTQETGPGRISYDLSTGDLKYYNALTSTAVPIILASTGSHDTLAVNASNAALHHTIGTGAFNAAAGNHGHGGFLDSGSDSSQSIPANTTSFSYRSNTAGAAFTAPISGNVLIIANATIGIGAAGTQVGANVQVKTGTTAGSGTAAGSCRGSFSSTTLTGANAIWRNTPSITVATTTTTTTNPSGSVTATSTSTSTSTVTFGSSDKDTTTVSRTMIWTGLTSGTTYNANFYHYNGGSVAANFDYASIIVYALP